MGWLSTLRGNLQKAIGPGAQEALSSVGMPRDIRTWLQGRIDKSGGTDTERLVHSILLKSAVSPTGYVGVSDVTFRGMRQQFFERRYLIDLYTIAHNCSSIKTAIMSIRNQVFRRGIKFEPAFDYKCPEDGKTFTTAKAKEANMTCEKHGVKLVSPDKDQLELLGKFIAKANLNGQNLVDICRQVLDDINICLVPGTLIRTTRDDLQYQPIEDIKVGDWVYTHLGKARRVQEVMCREVEEELVELFLSNGVVVRITKEHPVYTTRGWVKAGDLTMEHILVKLSDITGMGRNHLTLAQHQEIGKKSGLARVGKSRGRYQGISPRKGLSWVQYYGVKRAGEIVKKLGQALKGRPWGLNFRAKAGTFRGENNPRYIDGRSGASDQAFTKELKRQVMERDQFTCQLCSRYPAKLVVHHIDGDKFHSHPDNLVTLCLSCHMKLEGPRIAWRFATLLKRKVQQRTLITVNGTQIKKIDSVYYQGPVYNLKVEEANSYAGQGIIYHNCDDGFVFVSSEYRYEENPDGSRSIYRLPKQIYRMDPVFMRFDLDRRGVPGMRHHICYLHRGRLLDIPFGEGWETNWRGECPECGYRTFPVMYIYEPQSIMVSESPAGWEGLRPLYLTEDEVCHDSWYGPSELYGYSPVLSIYEKILALIGMDRWLYDYFYERQVPQGVITTVTDNPDDLEVRKQDMMSKMMADPHYIPWIAVSSRTGQGQTQFVRFAYSLDELDYLPVRQEIQERIAGLFGVSAIWMADTSQAGGLRSDTQQLIVTSRTVEGLQGIYNRKIFPFLLKVFGVTDWKLVMEVPEEREEQVELTLLQMRVQIAQMFAMMGFGVKYDPETKTFSFSGEVPSRDQAMAGQPGGALGIGGGPPGFPGAGAVGQPVPQGAPDPLGRAGNELGRRLGAGGLPKIA